MQKVQYITGQFVDYKGDTRKYVMAAVSFNTSYAEDYLKCVSIGVSACLPEDEFNLELGKRIAYGKALKNTKHRLYTQDFGMINEAVVTALLTQEKTYFESNPAYYLKGYEDKQNKYLRKKKVLDYIENADEQKETALNYVAQISDDEVDEFVEALNYLRSNA